MDGSISRLKLIGFFFLFLPVKSPIQNCDGWFVRNNRINSDLNWQPVGNFMRRKADKIYAAAMTHPDLVFRIMVDYDANEKIRKWIRSRN
ncbi:hypothetical protein ABEB36_000704 [Hypothenemus hampei]|uniref:Uncharacterized protein n=1 Tax=Hypothenemus hampei TaxID=57062 RepID=A0ABD1FC76_HYPHA